MSYESNTGLNVSNHYGPREVGGTEGSLTTGDNKRTYAFDGSATNLPGDIITLPVGATGRVLDISGTAPAVLTFAGVDVLAASYAAPVEFDATSDQKIEYTGTVKNVVTVEFDMA